MMFEFMIPEPARLHRLATGSVKNILTAPIDPRNPPANAMQWKMENADVDESLLQFWAKEYKVKLIDKPEKYITYTAETGSQYLENSAVPRTLNLQVPENYKIYEADILYAFRIRLRDNTAWFSFDNLSGGTMAVESTKMEGWTSGKYPAKDLNVVGNYGMIYFGQNGITDASLNVNAKCTLSDNYLKMWRETNFDAIIEAYEVAQDAFLKAQADLDAQEPAEVDANKTISFYRDMEGEVLKHNCIAYLLQNTALKLGEAFTQDNDTMQSFKVRFGDDLDAYASLAKFMEQALEWTIMDYTFYPYYWADKKNWQEMYLSKDLDPLFRNFLQAGMARVIVTVKPGFEDAIQFFMTTGRIWNGGEVPVIGDPMYLSIVDELKQPKGEKQGNYWINRIPTSLTILQAESIGLVVDEPLPIFPLKDIENCDNPEDLEFESAFSANNALLNGKEEFPNS